MHYDLKNQCLNKFPTKTALAFGQIVPLEANDWSSN